MVGSEASIPHAPSWYAATANDDRLRPGLQQDIHSDVCIVGGGFSGLSTALHLAERGINVTLLEAKRVGWGASGRNGGQIHSGFRRDAEWFEARIGLEAARQVWELGEAAKALVGDLVSRHAIACDLREGLLSACHKERFVAEERTFADHMRTRYGYDQLEPLDRLEITEATGADCYYGGSRDRGGGHLHPLNFALGLATAAESAGATIFDQSPVERLDRKDGKIYAVTRSGSVSAETVVIAGNGYVEGLEPDLDARVMPISNFILATEPIGAGMDGGPLSGGECAADTRFVVHYWRPTADGRLLFGGGETFSRAFPDDIRAFVHKYFSRIYPQFSHVDISYAWGGTLAVTQNRLPFVRRVNKDIYAIGGFSGQGVALAPFAGKIVADALAGDASLLDVVSRFPCPKFPGGTLFRAPILALAMTWFALRDRI